MKLKDPTHVSKGIVFSPGEDSCDMWLGAVTPEGYGDVEYKGENYFAHYFHYHTNENGFQRGPFVRHTCGNNQCMNLNHMVTEGDLPMGCKL